MGALVWWWGIGGVKFWFHVVCGREVEDCFPSCLLGGREYYNGRLFSERGLSFETFCFSRDPRLRDGRGDEGHRVIIRNIGY